MLRPIFRADAAEREADSDPAGQHVSGLLSQGGDGAVGVVAPGDVVEAAAPGSGEGLAVELVDLLKSLQAVGDEAGTDDIEAGAAGAPQLADRIDSGRSDPGGGSEDGLKGELGEPVGQVEPLREELNSALALGSVGVPCMAWGME